MSEKPLNTSAAQTDATEFIEDCDGGQLAHKLSIALGEVAAAVSDNKKSGHVKLEFTFTRVDGAASQVAVAHRIAFDRPTLAGKRSEEETRSTVFYVGRAGKLTLMPESQTDMFTRKGDVAQRSAAA